MDNFNTFNPSFRAQVVTRRTYNRPLNDEGTEFESWQDTVDRVIRHQKWLWQRQVGRKLWPKEREELEELRQLMYDRKVSTSGRTLWLGGTDIAKKREASQFNCAFTHIETVHDVVDGFWNLLQGCGQGFRPIVGNLNGFTKPVEVSVVRSQMTIAHWEAGIRGHEENRQRFYEDVLGRQVWELTIGDSAAAWAKSAGKVLAMKRPVDVIRLDFSQIRAAGIRLKGYGWISSGDEQLQKALQAIVKLLSDRAGKLLTRIDILDLMNHLGTTLSSRRSAEIALMAYGEPEWEEFAVAKKDHYLSEDTKHRGQSNNTLMFFEKPTKDTLTSIFAMMIAAGGSEPGFYNAQHALLRAPWFKGTNPCGEILLGNKNFCNLVEIDVSKFNGNFGGLLRAVYIAARANYRQTCVDFAQDPILQRAWHELNEFLRLCGVGLTGIVKWEHCIRKDDSPLDRMEKDSHLQAVRKYAHLGANSMADEFGTPRSKAITTIKPSGTLSKIMDCPEGAHKPLGRYIFNWINFSKHDPLVKLLEDAGYDVRENPYDNTGVIVALPVSYEGVEFDVARMTIDGQEVDVEVNLESAVEQLERYKWLMDNYVDHNCSVTIYYSPEEAPGIVEWLHDNWEHYVGVSFLYRTDPTKTAEDLGYPYLPQEIVTKAKYDAYVSRLKPVDLDKANSMEELEDQGCATGACPIR